MPERFSSVEIMGIYKGFTVKTTITDPELTKIVYTLIRDAKNIIDLMEKDGWTPPVAIQAINPEVKELKEADPSMCAVHNKKMKERSGNGGQAFYSHGRKLADGRWDWCSGSGWNSEK